MQARLLGFPIAAGMVLIAGAANADISINGSIGNSVPDCDGGTIVFQSQVFLNAAVTSTYALQSVVAQLGTETANLGISGTSAQGGLDLTGLDAGAQTITLTATDIYNTASAPFSIDFTLHGAPTVTFTQPVDYAFANPNVNLDATCQASDVAESPP